MKRCRIKVILIAVLLIISLSGCSALQYAARFGSSLLQEAAEANTAEELTEEALAEQLVQCFSARDAQALKTLFCERTQALSDIDAQIQRAFAFFEGDPVSYDEKILGSEGKHTSYGTVKEHDWSFPVDAIQTDAGRCYRLWVAINLTYLDDPKREGITRISLTDTETGEEVEIGYAWPDHHTEGYKLGRQIIRALGAGDAESLKASLNENARSSAALDDQIEKAFVFFEGTALEGKLDQESERYDGRLDHRTTVYDEETIENHTSVSVYAEVVCEPVITDTGDEYEVRFSGYLTHEREPGLIGAEQIIITDKKGNRAVIGLTEEE